MNTFIFTIDHIYFSWYKLRFFYEVSKIIENVQRDVNATLINELALMFKCTLN